MLVMSMPSMLTAFNLVADVATYVGSWTVAMCTCHCMHTPWFGLSGFCVIVRGLWSLPQLGSNVYECDFLSEFN